MTVKDEILDIIQRRKGVSSRQLILAVDGIGDPSRLCRFLQQEGKVRSEWKTTKVRGKIKRYKLYFGR